jgi:hypothetical protein
MRCKRCEKQLLLKSEKELALCSVCQIILSRPPLFESSYAYDDKPCCFAGDIVDDFVDDFDALSDEHPCATNLTYPFSRNKALAIIAALIIPLLATVAVTLIELDFLQRAAITSKEILSLLVLLGSFYFAHKVIKEVCLS